MSDIIPGCSERRNFISWFIVRSLLPSLESVRRLTVAFLLQKQTLLNLDISSHFPLAVLTTPSSETTKLLSKRPPIIHTPPPMMKKTTSKLFTTEPHPAQTHKPTHDKLKSRRVVRKIIVTVTRHICRESSKVVPTFGARETSGGSSANAGLIVGIVFGVLAFLVLVALLCFCLRRRKFTKKK